MSMFLSYINLWLFPFMIGTFQAETDEEIAYGLVHPLASWDPIWAQVRSLLRTFQARQTRSQWDKKCM